MKLTGKEYGGCSSQMILMPNRSCMEPLHERVSPLPADCSVTWLPRRNLNIANVVNAHDSGLVAFGGVEG